MNDCGVRLRERILKRVRDAARYRCSLARTMIMARQGCRALQVFADANDLFVCTGRETARAIDPRALRRVRRNAQGYAQFFDK